MLCLFELFILHNILILIEDKSLKTYHLAVLDIKVFEILSATNGQHCV